MAHLVDVLVDGGVFFDVRIGARHVGFGLVVIVVTDEVFDGVVREQAGEFAVKLRGKGLVGRQDQGGLLHLRHDRGHGVGFARSRHAQQRLVGQPLINSARQFVYGLRLITGGFEVGNEGKGFHAVSGDSRVP